MAAIVERERLFLPPCRVTGRCKHYMISQLETGKFVIVGEPRVHNSLEDMVKFHMKVHSYEAPDLSLIPSGFCHIHVLILLQGFSRLAVRYLCNFSSISTTKIQVIINCQHFNDSAVIFFRAHEEDYSIVVETLAIDNCGRG